MDPDQLMIDLSIELHEAIKAMSKATTVEEKVAYSQVVKNLSEAMGVFLDLGSGMMDSDFDDD